MLSLRPLSLRTILALSSFAASVANAVALDLHSARSSPGDLAVTGLIADTPAKATRFIRWSNLAKLPSAKLKLTGVFVPGIHTRFHLEGERCSRLRSDPAKFADEFDVFRLSHLRRIERDGRCTLRHATDRRREDAHRVRAFDLVCVENDNTGLHGNGFIGPRIRAACQERAQQTELLLNPAGGVCIRAPSSRKISLAEHGRMCFMDRI